MRLRNNPNALGRLLEHQDIVVFKPQENKGKWKEFFKNDNPIYIELAMGRGQFITTHAARHPHINYIGMDVRNEVIVKALEKVVAQELKNIIFLPFNIHAIDEAFEKNEIDLIYINFCDPWPKVRHAKRRLTHRLTLQKYREILKPDGKIVFKTDNRELFDFSVEEFKAAGFDIVSLTNDLESLKDPENVKTEYEQKFTNKGMSINRLEAKKNNQPSDK